MHLYVIFSNAQKPPSKVEAKTTVSEIPRARKLDIALPRETAVQPTVIRITPRTAVVQPVNHNVISNASVNRIPEPSAPTVHDAWTPTNISSTPTNFNSLQENLDFSENRHDPETGRNLPPPPDFSAVEGNPSFYTNTDGDMPNPAPGTNLPPPPSFTMVESNPSFYTSTGEEGSNIGPGSGSSLPPPPSFATVEGNPSFYTSTGGEMFDTGTANGYNLPPPPSFVDVQSNPSFYITTAAEPSAPPHLH